MRSFLRAPLFATARSRTRAGTRSSSVRSRAWTWTPAGSREGVRAKRRAVRRAAAAALTAAAHDDARGGWAPRYAGLPRSATSDLALCQTGFGQPGNAVPSALPSSMDGSDFASRPPIVFVLSMVSPYLPPYPRGGGCPSDCHFAEARSVRVGGSARGGARDPRPISVWDVSGSHGSPSTSTLAFLDHGYSAVAAVGTTTATAATATVTGTVDRPIVRSDTAEARGCARRRAGARSGTR